MIRWVQRALFVPALILALVGVAAAAEERKRDDRPERGVAVYSEFSGVIVPVGDTVRMDLTVENKGRRDEIVSLKLASVPKGWKASLRGGGFTVTGVAVPEGKTRTLSFMAEPDKSVGIGSYTFTIEGVSSDAQLKASYPITVNVQERSKLGADDVQVTTSYPVLRGQTDASFEFSLEVNNKSDLDRSFDLVAQAPEKWEVNFKPAYEAKQISSIRVKGASNERLAVQVTPPKDAKAGEYPIQVRISSGEARTDVKLVVVLTGIYKIDAATPTGIMSAEAVRGKPTTLSLIVRNTGSADNRNISFNAFKPENWKVEFNPEKIESLEPNAFKQVEVSITPAGEALVGDYSVALSVDGERSNKMVEMRITVKAPTVWGWLGVGLIALVIGGMGGLFVWLGRR